MERNVQDSRAMFVGQRRSDPGWSDDIWSVVCGGGGLVEDFLRKFWKAIC